MSMNSERRDWTLEEVRKEFLGMPFDKDVERRISATGFTFAVSLKTGKVSDIFPHVLRSPSKPS